MNGNHILRRLVDAIDADIFTDAEECQGTIEALHSIATEGREYLNGQPPSPTVRIWHGSFDGDMGTLSNVALSEREFEDWLLQQVGKERDDFTEWYGDQAADANVGLDDFLREHCDHCDSWTWDSFDVPVPGIGQKPRIVVALDGGLVSGASSDVPVDMVVIDYDIEGADRDDIAEIPQSRRTETEEALIRSETVDVDPLWTNAIFAVEAGHWPDGHDNAFLAPSTGEALPGQAAGIVTGSGEGLVTCAAHGRSDVHPCGDDLEEIVAAAEASFQPQIATGDAVQLLRDAVEAWEDDMEDESPINGSDAVDWLCGFYAQAKNVIAGRAPNAAPLPEGADAIISSYHEGSISKYDAATDLTLLGVPHFGVDELLAGWPDAPLPPAVLTESVPCQPFAPVSENRQSLMAIRAELLRIDQAIAEAWPTYPGHAVSSQTPRILERITDQIANIVTLLQRQAIDKEFGPCS